MTALLEIDELAVELTGPRGRTYAVQGLSLAVGPGETVGLVGESGCGKSMSLRAVLGLLPKIGRVTGGVVRFAGETIVEAGRNYPRRLRGEEIAMVFQEPTAALNPVHRVGDQIAELPRRTLGFSRGEAHARALDLMRQVGIPDPERRYRAFPHELSGGLRQRVMIAIALSGRPRLLLCDEPTTALDVTIQDQVLKLLVEIQRSDKLGILFVTHDLAVVAQTCTRVEVMYAGRVVESGMVADVFTQPRHPYTIGLLGSVPVPGEHRRRLASISGSPPELDRVIRTCPFAPRCLMVEPECRQEPAVLRETGHHTKSACRRRNDLEDVNVRERLGDAAA